MTVLIALIAGARPNFMKIASIILALEARAVAIMVPYVRLFVRLLLKAPSSLCLVVGGVTSTMACAIAASNSTTWSAMPRP